MSRRKFRATTAQMQLLLRCVQNQYGAVLRASESLGTINACIDRQWITADHNYSDLWVKITDGGCACVAMQSTEDWAVCAARRLSKSPPFSKESA